MKFRFIAWDGWEKMVDVPDGRFPDSWKLQIPPKPSPIFGQTKMQKIEEKNFYRYERVIDGAHDFIFAEDCLGSNVPAHECAATKDLYDVRRLCGAIYAFLRGYNDAIRVIIMLRGDARTLETFDTFRRKLEAIVRTLPEPERTVFMKGTL